MKSDALLPRYEDPQEAKSPPPAQFDPSAASYSQAISPLIIEEMFSRIMGQLQTLQQQYKNLDARVEQVNLNVERCPKWLEPEDDDESEWVVLSLTLSIV
jgi:hypothetical protein